MKYWKDNLKSSFFNIWKKKNIGILLKTIEGESVRRFTNPTFKGILGNFIQFNHYLILIGYSL